MLSFMTGLFVDSIKLLCNNKFAWWFRWLALFNGGAGKFQPEFPVVAQRVDSFLNDANITFERNRNGNWYRQVV